MDEIDAIVSEALHLEPTTRPWWTATFPTSNARKDARCNETRILAFELKAELARVFQRLGLVHPFHNGETSDRVADATADGDWGELNARSNAVANSCMTCGHRAEVLRKIGKFRTEVDKRKHG